MRRLAGFAVVLLILAAASPVFSGDEVKLKMKGPRTVFMKPAGMYRHTPVSIRVSAELEGIFEDPEEYYCLEEEWEWGDETESLREPDCDPWEEGAQVNRHYSASHTFRYPGTYTILLRLQRSGDTIIMGKHTVRIRGQ
jgi:hypothetical protein